LARHLTKGGSILITILAMRRLRQDRKFLTRSPALGEWHCLVSLSPGHTPAWASSVGGFLVLASVSWGGGPSWDLGAC
jgi:hypothetical protein